jgi:hypothetical protein
VHHDAAGASLRRVELPNTQIIGDGEWRATADTGTLLDVDPAISNHGVVRERNRGRADDRDLAVGVRGPTLTTLLVTVPRYSFEESLP